MTRLYRGGIGNNQPQKPVLIDNRDRTTRSAKLSGPRLIVKNWIPALSRWARRTDDEYICLPVDLGPAAGPQPRGERLGLLPAERLEATREYDDHP